MTGKNIYDALRDDLAIPIGMQDFDRERQQKTGDQTRSQYPAYPMYLSTRDMARLGLLMLRQGQWRDHRIIPAEWVRRSTSVRTPLAEMQPQEARAGPFGYGYLWWVWDGSFGTGPYQGAYSACGAFGQYITVLPALDMVVAHKTWPSGKVHQSDYLRLLDLLTGRKPASAFELANWEHISKVRPEAYAIPKPRIAIKLNPGIYDSYAGKYSFASETNRPGKMTLTIKRNGDALISQVTGQFAEEIFPESSTTFFNAMEMAQLTFIKNDQGEVTSVILHATGLPDREGKKITE
jgi:hypothetical protein